MSFDSSHRRITIEDALQELLVHGEGPDELKEFTDNVIDEWVEENKEEEDDGDD